MAKKTTKHEFTGSPVDDLISTPVVAIARAQAMMAKEQLHTLMDTCFTLKNDTYEPVLLKMTLTRSAFDTSSTSKDTAEIAQYTTHFYLPLITIFPINSLGIENAEIDFGIDITSQYRVENDTKKSSKFSLGQPADMGLLGKISTFPVSDKDAENANDIPYSLRISLDATKMPLTRGLLEIINIYSTSLITDEIKGKI